MSGDQDTEGIADEHVLELVFPTPDNRTPLTQGTGHRRLNPLQELEHEHEGKGKSGRGNVFLRSPRRYASYLVDKWEMIRVYSLYIFPDQESSEYVRYHIEVCGVISYRAE